MKNMIRYLSIALLFFVLPAVHGQKAYSDDRRSTDEQARFEKSVPGNPAKISDRTRLDPKRDLTRSQPDPTNWKPVTSPAGERKEVAPPVDNSNLVDGHESTGSVRTQTPATVQGKPAGHRAMAGSKTQAEGQKAPERNFNSMGKKGTKTQPEGLKPIH